MTTTSTDAIESAIKPEDFFEFVARPDLRADPYPFFARLRTQEPIYELDVGFRLYLVSGYDHASEVLRDPRFSSDERNTNAYKEAGSEQHVLFANTPFGRVARSMLVFRDDPDHKRLRDLVQKAFTRRVVEDLRPRISQLVDELLDPVVDAGGGDLMSDFAYPLPVIVICELLGVPPADRHRFMDWAHDFAQRFEVQPLRTEDMEQRGDAATTKLTEYFEELIAMKRSKPAGDLISSLITVEDDGDRLSHNETLATCLLLLLAGHETTANLIGNGTYALMRHRDQWDRLVGNPSLVRSAVEEILRYDSPVQMVQRIPLSDVTIGGHMMAGGVFCGVILAAANRDPSRFSDPDRFDIARDEAPLVSFGAGIHFCLGAPLARLETQLALDALALRAPGLHMTDEPRWRPSFVLRGLERLPIGL